MTFDIYSAEINPLPQVANNATCNVVVFLERHNQMHPVQDIKSLLSFFKQKGFNTFCFETSKSKKDFYSHIKKEIMVAQQLLKISGWEEKINPELLEPYKVEIGQYAGFLEHHPAEIEILDLLDSLGMRYCAMDSVHDPLPFPENKIEWKKDRESLRARDRHMSNMMKKSCDHGGVLSLVGMDHYMGIQENLEHIANIKGYFTPSWPVETEPSVLHWFPEIKYLSDARLSSDQVYHVDKTTNITVIDLHKDPSFGGKISQIIKKDYNRFWDEFIATDLNQDDLKNHRVVAMRV